MLTANSVGGATPEPTAVAASTWRMCACILLALLLPSMVILSGDFGATWDEPQQRQKAHHLLDYWTGRSAVLPVPDDGAHWYGAPLDVVSAALERSTSIDPYVIRHAVNASVGWLGLVAAWKLAEQLFSPAVGLLTIILLTVNPRYIADSMNNPKDLPFATVATTFLLLLTRLRGRPPFLSGSTALLMALVLGVGLNIRAGALMLVGYLAVLLGHRLQTWEGVTRSDVLREALSLGAVVLGSLSIGWIAWPWAYDAPLMAPLRAMTALSRFPWGGSVLFDGEWVAGTAIPDTYVPVWLWLALPPVVVVGAVGTLQLLLRDTNRGALIALWGTVLFPLMFVIGTGATLYDGLRHLLFVIPPLTVLSAAGWVSLLSGSQRWVRVVVTPVLILGVLEPVVFQIRNHPNQTAYVQPLAGGPAEAFARYDLDYWGNCLFQAMARIPGSPEGIPVTGWPLILLEANASRFPHLRIVPESDHHAIYDLRLARGTRPELLALSTDPAVVDRILTADGALLCAVRDRSRIDSDLPDTQNGLSDPVAEASVEQP